MASQPSDVASNDTVCGSTTSSQTSFKPTSSTDIGWNYGYLLSTKGRYSRIQCKLCNHTMSGGITRLKQHIARVSGNVKACPKSSDEAKRLCKEALEAHKSKKIEKRREQREFREQVNIRKEEDVVVVGSKRKMAMKTGAMDKFVRTIDLEATVSERRPGQQDIVDYIDKERTQAVHTYCAKWVYENDIPFNAIDNESFVRFVEAVGQYGPKYQPPSQYLLKEPLLKKEVASTKEMLKTQEEEWKNTGCSIMADAWSDPKRSIINLCVNCMEGTTFLSCKEASGDVHTGEYIFEYVNACIEQVGPSNVVQVVMDNASNNMRAAELMKKKRPNIFWSACATHTINLMLQDIGKLKNFKSIIERAKAFTIFIYSHHKTFDLMRRYTKRRDIVRPGVTRFATSFLTLQNLIDKKEQLIALVTSDAWEQCKYSKTSNGKMAFSTIVQSSFWNGVSHCLKVFAPLVNVLRLVDGDRKPSMAFLYGDLLGAKEQIKEACKNVPSKYAPILAIVDDKSKGRLDAPLHKTAYLLNPYYHYNGPKMSDDLEIELIKAFIECAEIIFHDESEKLESVINVEFCRYIWKQGHSGFGSKDALNACINKDYDPIAWWHMHGLETPNLRWMAKRILALTSSFSGCERNWSKFEGIHTKKRNRLDERRLNNLVYVRFNSKIINKKNKMTREPNIDTLIASDATKAQAWIVDLGEDGEDEEIEPGLTWAMVAEASGENEELQHRRSARNELTEVDEKDFVSEDDTEFENEIDEGFEFEDDRNQVLSGYGEEETEIEPVDIE